MSNATAPKAKTYYTVFDGIRGLGILLVLIAHARLFYLLEMTPVHGWENWLLQITDFNWVAMEWFFAMSGFLITGILLKAKQEPAYFRNFYSRRFLRIFPLYYGFLAFYFFVLPRFMNLSANPESAYSFVSQNQGWYWTYMANFLLAMQGTWLGEMSHLWSLSVEEHFYMVWPLLVYFLSNRKIMALSVIGIAISTLLRAYFTFRVGMSPISIYVMTITRVDSILMGSMLAVFVSGQKDFSRLLTLRKPLTILAGIFAPLLVWFYAKEGHFSAVGEAMKTQQQGHLYPLVVVYGYLMVGIASCALLVWLLTAGERNWLVRLFNNGFLRTLGVYSYGMYIIHFAVFGMFHQSPLSMASLSQALGSRALGIFTGFTLPFLATLGGAWAIWHGYEKHFLKLKKYFEAAPSPRAAKVPAVAPTVATSLLAIVLVSGISTEAKADPTTWSLRGSMSAWTAFEANWINDDLTNAANPGNAVLQAPRYRELEDLRPVIKLDSDIGFTVVAKPHLVISGSQIHVNGSSVPGTANVDFEWVEAYATAQLADTVSFTYGTQNYQWGPAELWSPSNKIFPFFIQNNTPLFYLRGRNLARVNWTPEKNTSVVLLAEVEKNKDPDFQFGVPFDKKAAIKAEHNFAIGAQDTLTASAIAGTTEDQAHWLGQYAQLSLGDAWALYADASENFKATAFYPNQDPTTGFVTMGDRPGGKGGFFTQVVGGAKYVFPKGSEARLEYLFNDLGWTRDQYTQALSSASIAPSLAAAQLNLGRFLVPGLDFTGRHYLYGSLRIGDAGHQDKLTWFLRYLHNLTDQSGSAIVSAEWTATDHMAVVLGVLGQLGADNTEMTQLGRATAQAALRIDL